ncbi:hypothetical protein PRIPAC_97484 [Pristionchus pacificus]|uniref:Uncharacterized protein n=1 Tax=Pristionchus pacificus TaxID=54126 RepID=A0A2A6D2X9_PRIPA|nr:hypothetical protein PRIPAC_97484 [Pristionchus pacificus]|eukprot:PDM84641.1 hypothetical protein PRIPAC_33664 [Pristionchus pacificus]
MEMPAMSATDPLGLSWPMLNPTLNVPFFNREIYRTVNLNAKASKDSSGLDLPFDDITTLRFFFNLGLQQCQSALLSQVHGTLFNRLPLLKYPELQAEALAYSPRSSPCSSVNNLSASSNWIHLRNQEEGAARNMIEDSEVIKNQKNHGQKLIRRAVNEVMSRVDRSRGSELEMGKEEGRVANVCKLSRALVEE